VELVEKLPKDVLPESECASGKEVLLGAALGKTLECASRYKSTKSAIAELLNDPASKKVRGVAESGHAQDSPFSLIYPLATSQRLAILASDQF